MAAIISTHAEKDSLGPSHLGLGQQVHLAGLTLPRVSSSGGHHYHPELLEAQIRFNPEDAA